MSGTTTIKDIVGLKEALRFAWTYWRHAPGKLALLLALSLTSALSLQVFAPRFAGALVDGLVQAADGSRDSSGAFWALGGLLAMGLIALATYAVGDFLWCGFASGNMRRICFDSFARVQRYSSDWHNSTFAGSTVRSITRGMWGFDTLGDVLYLRLLPTCIVLLGAVAMMATVHPLLGLGTALFAACFLGLSVQLALRWSAPWREAAQKADTRVSGAIADAIGCNAVVKGFGREGAEEQRLQSVLTDWRGAALASWYRMVAANTVQQALMLLYRAGLLGGALYLWQQGTATTGEVVAVVALHWTVSAWLSEAGRDIRQLERSVGEIGDSVRFRKLEPQVSDPSGAGALTVGDGEIRFDGVAFRYPGQPEPVYRDFDLRIAAGETVALVGHSGSGKSTLVKLLQRLYDLDAGRILIDGQDIASVTQDSLRRAIALVPQEPVLFHRSLADNIAYGRPEASMADIRRAAELAHADGFISRLPQGYETLVGERGVKLSGGERQRVAIARAILADCPILILDEATSSLDSESELLIQDALERLMAGRTAIVVAHRLSTIRRCDRVLVFDGGAVVEQGSHAELLARPEGRFRRLHAVQAGGMV